MLFQYQIQVKYRPSIPDNLKHLQFFYDNEQLKSFLQIIDEFSNLQVEEEQLDNLENNNQYPIPQLDTKIVDHSIIQLSNNFIPRGLITLEKLFDHNDIPRNPLPNSPKENIEICNIGSYEDIREVKIFSSLSIESKNKYLSLLKAYNDVFSLSYNELKTYDTSLIEHKIPLKLEAKPFK